MRRPTQFPAHTQQQVSGQADRSRLIVSKIDEVKGRYVAQSNCQGRVIDQLSRTEQCSRGGATVNRINSRSREIEFMWRENLGRKQKLKISAVKMSDGKAP